MLTEHEIEIRVRYQETDAQGVVHHANYVGYFELGRTEMMRAAGKGYEELEREGLMLVVAEITCRYFRPCYFGEVIRIRTVIEQAKGARIRHRYEVYRDETLLAEGASVVGCVGADGKPKRLPGWLAG